MIEDAHVVVIGAGIAGLSAAIEAARLGAQVTVITDGPLGRSNSIMAQGGIQLPLDEDDAELMVSDIVDVGGSTVDQGRVERLVEELRTIATGLESLGLRFDRDDEQRLVRRSAGGLSSPRIVTVGDQIGRPLMRVLKQQVLETCHVMTAHKVMDIIVNRGITVSTNATEITSGALIVATGGISYQQALDSDELTSNPPNENASLRSVLQRLGLVEMTPRRFQRHPFGLIESRRGITVSCVPESVAGLGPHLVTDRGDTVSELPAPRGQVVAAMNEALEAGSDIRITLDEMPESDLTRFPNVRRQIRDFGHAPRVRPVLHYELSGYPIAADQSSDVPGLFLAGEIVGGVHGEERLMGMGVADSLVHGRRAGESAARFVTGR